MINKETVFTITYLFKSPEEKVILFKRGDVPAKDEEEADASISTKSEEESDAVEKVISSISIFKDAEEGSEESITKELRELEDEYGFTLESVEEEVGKDLDSDEEDPKKDEEDKDIEDEEPSEEEDKSELNSKEDIEIVKEKEPVVNYGFGNNDTDPLDAIKKKVVTISYTESDDYDCSDSLNESNNSYDAVFFLENEFIDEEDNTEE